MSLSQMLLLILPKFDKCGNCLPIKIISVVLGLEMSSRTNFESLALRVKFLDNSPGHLRATQTMTWRQLRLHATVTLMALSLWHCLIKCLLHELVPSFSYFFLVLCSLAPRNLKRLLNVFWRQVLGTEAQVLVNNTEDYSWTRHYKHSGTNRRRTRSISNCSGTGHHWPALLRLLQWARRRVSYTLTCSLSNCMVALCGIGSIVE